MKKLLSILMVLALLAGFGAIAASAEDFDEADVIVEEFAELEEQAVPETANGWLNFFNFLFINPFEAGWTAMMMWLYKGGFPPAAFNYLKIPAYLFFPLIAAMGFVVTILGIFDIGPFGGSGMLLYNSFYDEMEMLGYAYLFSWIIGGIIG